MNILYKSFPPDRKSHGHQFKLNTWYKVEGKVKACKNGFHASENLIDAIRYVTPGWIGIVEVRGACDKESDKQAWEEMRVIKWKKWTVKDSMTVAIYSAEQCIDIYEKSYPDDNRPRLAIEAAKNVLKKDTKANRDAAHAAYAAAHAAYAAAYAAAADAKLKIHNFIISHFDLTI